MGRQNPAEDSFRPTRTSHQKQRHPTSSTHQKRQPSSTAGTSATPAITNTSTSTTTTNSNHSHRTRVCIKNLPQNVGETELRQFLKQQLKQLLRKSSGGEKEILITDCRVVHNNNNDNKNNNQQSKSKTKFGMAFVGFASPSIAADCVRLLHRSYWQTTRLTVEWAIPVAEQQKSGAKRLSQGASSAVDKKASSVNTTSTSATNEKPHPFIATAATSMSAAVVTEKQPDGDDPNDDSSSTSSSDSDDDSADPILLATSTSSQRKNDKAVPSSHSAMDFLRSKQKAVENLPDDAEDDNKDSVNDQTDNHAMMDDVHNDANLKNSHPLDGDKDGDAASTTSSSSSSSSSSSDSSSGDDNDQLLPMKSGNHNTTVTQNALSTSSVPKEQDSNDQEDSTLSAGIPSSTNRLFLRNLPFSATEDDITKHLQTVTATSMEDIDIIECHIARDTMTGNSKGFAFCTLASAEQAMAVLQACDGYDFQGRLLHILPAQPPPPTSINANASHSTSSNVLSYKQQQEQQRQQQAGTSTAGWSASVLRGDAVVQHLADRLGMTRNEMWNVKDGLSAGNAAVRLALGETAMIEENRTFFAQYGIDLEALVSLQPGNSGKDNNNNPPPRSTSALLIKNLPADTTVEELQAMLAVDNTTRILLPPSRAIALVNFSNPNDAKRAFRRFSYRRFKSVPLYLEWAPLLTESSNNDADIGSKRKLDQESEEITNGTGDQEEDAPQLVGPTGTLYVKNLSFATTEERLREYFKQGGKKNTVRTVRIPQKVAPIQRGAPSQQQQQSQSLGYGFVEFVANDAAREALRKWQGALLDGHALQLQPSSHTSATAGMPKPQTRNSKTAPSKLLVRNVPFQANRQELLQLFGSFGTLKKLRLPKKMDGRHRGFAFCEYSHAAEATHAKTALGRTHLYGRHLVLEWAEDDNEQQQQQPLDHLRAKAERDLLAPASIPLQGKRTKLS